MTNASSNKASYDWAASADEGGEEIEIGREELDWSGKKVNRQTGWDARAAGNFIGGGSGTGLLICAALAVPAASYLYSAVLGLVLAGLGLICVLAEIGHPLRFLNVLRRGNTSWMTREALIAPFMFGAGAVAAYTGGVPFSTAAAVFAAAYLYCQARMLQASKGIPAWRNKASIPLLLSTGLVEGSSLATLVCLGGGISLPQELIWLLLATLLVRRISWMYYLKMLAGENSAKAALSVLHRLRGPYENFGQTLPELLLLIGIFFTSGQSWPFVIASLAGVTSGWIMKYTLVTRAAFSQGLDMTALPKRRQDS